MTTYEDIRKHVAAAFKAGFVSTGSTPLYPTEYPNQPFTKPVAATWCRLSVQFAGRENASVGKGHQRTRGVVYLQVFIPEGQGTKDAGLAAAKLADIFENTSPTIAGSPAEFRTIELVHASKLADGWHQATASVEFLHDKIA